MSARVDADHMDSIEPEGPLQTTLQNNPSESQGSLDILPDSDSLISDLYNKQPIKSPSSYINNRHYGSYEIIASGNSIVSSKTKDYNEKYNNDVNKYNNIDYDIGQEHLGINDKLIYQWISAGFGPCSATCLGELLNSNYYFV